MIRAHTGHAGILASLHGAAFPPDEAWQASAFAIQLALPGVFGVIASTADAGRAPSPAALDESSSSRKGREDPEMPGFALARVAADEAEILTLAVVPAARRRGVGGALLGAVMQIAGARGASALFLEVSTANEAARALYDRAGFQAVGRRSRYYADGTDALVMLRTLSAGAAAVG